MALFTNADAVLNGTVLELFGTVDPDTFTISGDYVTGAALTGVIDGNGGANSLVLNAASLLDTTISNIAQTQLDGATVDDINEIDVGQLSQLGTISLGAGASALGVGSLRLFFPETLGSPIQSLSFAVTLDLGDGEEIRVINSAYHTDLTIDFSSSTVSGTGHLNYVGNNLADTITGTDGDDIIRGLRGEDVISGGAGNDRIGADQGDDIVFGDEGDDELWGNGGNDQVRGGDGNDIVGGGWGDDQLWGDDGADFLAGHNGVDTLLGGAGDDILEGGADADILNGQGGNDEAYYFYSYEAVTVDLNAGTASGGQAEGDQLISIESVSGSEFADTLTGTGGRNTLIGQGGDDTLNGLGGTDTIDGGAGADVIDGGGGPDTIDGGTGQDVINGGAGRDTITGGEGIDTIHGDGNNDLIFGGQGDDMLFGDNGRDEIHGGEGADTLDGGIANDQLWGDADNDTISGGSGRDEIHGGTGTDTLTGGTQTDIFVFSDGDGTDTITDFANGQDDIAFTGAVIDFASLTITDGADGHAYIDYGSGDQIIVENAAGQIEASDFIFNF